MIILRLYNKRASEFEVLYNDEYFKLNPLDIISREKLNELCSLSNLEEVIILPQLKKNAPDALFISSEGTRKNLELVHSNLSENLIELPGKINSVGEVQDELKESQLNLVLRQVFTSKPKMVFICLTNAIFNPSHEKGLSNLIKGAGYKVARSFELFLV